MNKFQPTLQQIKDPEQLLKLIRDFTANLLELDRKIAVTQRDAEQGRRQMFAEMDKRRSVLDGVKEGAGSLVKLGVDQNATVKSNLTATVAPTATDDVTKGYGVGSKWIDTVTPAVYFCADASSGAAVWSGPV